MKRSARPFFGFLCTCVLVAGTNAYADEEYTAREVYLRTSPSVVAVIGINQERNKCGQGAGSILNDAGAILTNAHVVIDGDTGNAYPDVTVFLKPAQVVGDSEQDLVRGVPASVAVLDRKSDLAVLRLSRPVPGLVPVTFGDSGRLEIGEPVAAIGHPTGGGFWTMTTGTLSGRLKQGDLPFLQTEVAMNPGNSGGPLLDRAGLLVGVNTFVRRESASGARLEGMSYSLEAAFVARWLERIRVAFTVAPAPSLARTSSPPLAVDAPRADDQPADHRPPPSGADSTPGPRPPTPSNSPSPPQTPSPPPQAPSAPPPTVSPQAPQPTVQPAEPARQFTGPQGQPMFGVPNTSADLQQLARSLLQSLQRQEAGKGLQDQTGRALDRAKKRVKDRDR